METKIEELCSTTLRGLDPDIVRYIAGCALDDDKVISREDLADVVTPLLVSSGYASDFVSSEAIASNLWTKIDAVSVREQSSDPRPDLVLLKDAVRIGQAYKKAEAEAEAIRARREQQSMDPRLQRRTEEAVAGCKENSKSNSVACCSGTKKAPQHPEKPAGTADSIGFIIIDGSGALFGSVVGGVKAVLHRMSVELPRKPGKGGQSALRQSRHNFVTKVASMAAVVFLSNTSKAPAGLVVAGSGDLKTQLLQDGKMDPRLAGKVALTLDVPYGGEKGFNHAIKLSAAVPSNLKLDHEVKVVEAWLQEVHLDSGNACFGLAATISALECGAVRTLLVAEELTQRRLTLRSVGGVEEAVVLSAAQLREEPEILWDAAAGRPKQVVDEAELVEWLAGQAGERGCAVERVSSATTQGSQFCHGWGGVGAMLRFHCALAQ